MSDNIQISDSSGSQVVLLVGVQRVLGRLSRLQEIATDDLMEELGLFFISQIQIRTAEGKDYNEQLFEPYSSQYARTREFFEHSTDKVNLMFDGTMMSAMSYETGENSVTLFFQNTSGKVITRTQEGRTKTYDGTLSSPLKAYYLNQNREFFALSDSDQERALEIINRYIDENLNRG